MIDPRILEPSYFHLSIIFCIPRYFRILYHDFLIMLPKRPMLYPIARYHPYFSSTDSRSQLPFSVSTEMKDFDTAILDVVLAISASQAPGKSSWCSIATGLLPAALAPDLQSSAQNERRKAKSKWHKEKFKEWQRQGNVPWITAAVWTDPPALLLLPYLLLSLHLLSTNFQRCKLWLILTGHWNQIFIAKSNQDVSAL